MIFIHGPAHMDPHGGNVMVKPIADKDDFQVHLLDHGLYKELNDDCNELGGNGLETMFSIMLLNRSRKSANKRRTDLRTKICQLLQKGCLKIYG